MGILNHGNNNYSNISIRGNSHLCDYGPFKTDKEMTTINDDIGMVCGSLGVPFETITGHDRHQDVCDKRTACVYALHLTGKYKGVQIAYALDKRSHTMLGECIRRVKTWNEYPRTYARQLAYVGKAIDALRGIIPNT